MENKKHYKAELASEGCKVWFTEEPKEENYMIGDSIGAGSIGESLHVDAFEKACSEWLSSYQLIPFAEQEQLDKLIRHVFDRDISGVIGFDKDIYEWLESSPDITQLVEVRSNCCGRCVDSDDFDGEDRLFFKRPVKVEEESQRDIAKQIVSRVRFESHIVNPFDMVDWLTNNFTITRK